jgi:hypothetical protein
MSELVRVVKDFIGQSNIQLNAKKVEILKLGKDHHQSFHLLIHFSSETTFLDCTDDKLDVIYLVAH